MSNILTFTAQEKLVKRTFQKLYYIVESKPNFIRATRPSYKRNTGKIKDTLKLKQVFSCCWSVDD